MVSVARRLFPAFMNGCRCICGAFHEDNKSIRVHHLTELVASVKITTLKTETVLQNVLSRKTSNKVIPDSKLQNYEPQGIVATALELSIRQMSSNTRSEVVKLFESNMQTLKNTNLLKKDENRNINIEFFRNIAIYLIARHLLTNFGK